MLYGVFHGELIQQFEPSKSVPLRYTPGGICSGISAMRSPVICIHNHHFPIGHDAFATFTFSGMTHPQFAQIVAPAFVFNSGQILQMPNLFSASDFLVKISLSSLSIILNTLINKCVSHLVGNYSWGSRCVPDSGVKKYRPIWLEY